MSHWIRVIDILLGSFTAANLARSIDLDKEIGRHGDRREGQGEQR